MFFQERLRPDHDLSRFSSGQLALDGWLRDSALHAGRSGTGRTCLWLDGSGEVVAFFTLAPSIIRREGLPSPIGRGAPDVIPAILIAKLALDQHLHGQGLGGALLADALTTALDAVAKAGGRLVLVDAIDERAHRFYAHHGFHQVEGDTHRMVMNVSDAARSMGIALP